MYDDIYGFTIDPMVDFKISSLVFNFLSSKFGDNCWNKARNRSNRKNAFVGFAEHINKSKLEEFKKYSSEFEKFIIEKHSSFADYSFSHEMIGFYEKKV
jgi:hypothetical protein